MKKQIILITLLSIISFYSFSQTKDSTKQKEQTRVIVSFPDSNSYYMFINYLGSLPVSNPASTLYTYFKSLPARLDKVIADKSKRIKK